MLPADPQTALFTRWTRLHAFALLLATAVGLAVAWPALVSLIAVASFSALWFAVRTRLPTRESFGAAHAVTTLRLIATLSLPCLARAAWPAALIALVAFSLDGLDGWIARRQGTGSLFGALFDMESDAFFMLAMSLCLFCRGDLPAWVLLPGLWRYAYALVLALRPAPSGEARRSRIGRWAFAAASAALIAALATPSPLAAPFAAFAAAAISASFVRSLYQTYRWPSVDRNGAIAR